MQLHNLQPKTKNKKTMIVGRGGTRGKTSGRGGKGQTARAGNKRRPELRDFIKRIPKLRGRGVNQNKAFGKRPVNVNVGDIDTVFKNGDTVSPKTLIEKHAISTFEGMVPSVKMLSDGDITKKIIVENCLLSAKAREKIEKAGGTIK